MSNLHDMTKRRKIDGPQRIPLVGGKRTTRKIELRAIPQNDADHSNEVQPGIRRYVFTDRQFAESVALLLTAAGQLGDNTAPPDHQAPPAEPAAITIHLHNRIGQTAREHGTGLVVDVFLQDPIDDDGLAAR